MPPDIGLGGEYLFTFCLCPFTSPNRLSCLNRDDAFTNMSNMSNLTKPTKKDTKMRIRAFPVSSDPNHLFMVTTGFEVFVSIVQ